MTKQRKQVRCVKCSSQPRFGMTGKTFYLLEGGDILCHRHWYQLNTPQYELAAEYDDMNAKLNPKAKRDAGKPIEAIKAKIN